MRLLLASQTALLGRHDCAVVRGLALMLVLAAPQQRRDEPAQPEGRCGDRDDCGDALCPIRKARSTPEVRLAAVRTVLPAGALLDPAARAAPQWRLVCGGEDRVDLLARTPARGLPLLVVE